MSKPLVGVIMGSKSDLDVMEGAAKALEEFAIPHEVRVISAHRAPTMLSEYASSARDRGLKAIIAGAGGAAHLPGVTAAFTTLPVIGVPIPTKHLGGVDSLYSIVQMPSGIPVATMAIGGAKNAGLMVVRMLAMTDPALAQKLDEYAQSLKQAVEEMDAAVNRPG